MRNFVIINGVNSNTINGLGINELPPITKPEMRNIREEIDGRDGDIITKLGYSAYDKTITIGLFGTGYDVDNIIKFFNKEGTIVFSNEPDKYYNFTQVNGFDIERLLKFKTASITFHCQPFKYPTIETQKIIQPTILTSDGESITINNTAVDNLGIDLKGNTSQSGTPTPTSPIPVSVVSGDNSINVVGKNLIPFSDIISTSGTTSNGITFTLQADGTIKANGTATAGISIYLTTNYIEQKAGTYTFSDGIASGQSGTTFFLYADVRHLDETSWDTKNFSTAETTTRTRTIEETFKFKPRIVIRQGQILNNLIFKPQLELGNQATPYVPYQSQTYEVDLGDIELCKIGTYQDYIYKDSGKWYKHCEIGKVVLNGSETWTSGTTSVSGHYRYYYQGSNILSPSTTGETPLIYCSHYKGQIMGTAGSWGGHQGISLDVGNNKIVINDDTYYLQDVSSYKTWLSTNNVSVYYVLSTPYLSLIEDNNLIEQLDNLESAMSYEGQTNISQVNNDKAFIISAKALEKGTNEVVVNNIGNVYSKPLLALEGNGNVDIYLDDTQILKANVESKMNIDINTLEAYNPDTMTLLNRQVIGNYNSMTLQPGNNTIRIDGALDKATISNYTRWL